MQSWQTVVVCVALILVPQGTLGHPRALEESEPALLKINDDVNHRQPQGGVFIPIQNTGDRKHDKMSEEEFKKIARSASQEEEDTMKMKVLKDEEKPAVSREFSVKDTEQKKDEILGSSKVELSALEIKDEHKDKEDDPTRSKKSTDMRELSFNTSPTTTVCIQVRSDHRPSHVVCGPQVGDDKKDDKPVLPTARYSFSPSPAQAFYNPLYDQREQIAQQFPPSSKQPLYMRVNTQDIEPSRTFPASGIMPMKMPSQMPSQGPSMSPAGARGSLPMRRTQTQPEDDNNLKPSEGAQPAAPAQPFRIVPQTPPASVVVHKQYYQAAPIPPFANNLIGPSRSPVKFDCTLHSDAAQYPQPYGYALYRNSPSDVRTGYPISGELIIPDGLSARMAQGPSDPQGYYYDPQGRAAQPEGMMGSPYEYAMDPWVGTTFVGEDGQLYKIDDSQARSAANDQWDQENLRASAPSSNIGMTMDELRAKYHEQEDAMKKSSQKLQELQQQLNHIAERATAEEKEKKKSIQSADLPKEPATPSRDSPSESSDEPKKPEQNKNIKRHSIRLMNRK